MDIDNFDHIIPIGNHRYTASIVGAIKRQTRVIDGILLLSVPTVLVVAYLLPVGVRESLVFEYTDPSLLTAFASAFVHLDRLHLFVNLGTYLLVVPTTFTLSLLNGNRRRFYTVFVTFVGAFPVVLAYLNLAAPRSAVAFGFSGIVMAFVGYLPLALATYANVHFDIGPQTSVAPVFFFSSLALIAILIVQSAGSLGTPVFLVIGGIIGVSLLTATVFIASVALREDQLEPKVIAAVGAHGYFEVFIVAIVLFLVFPFVAFPPNPTVDGGVLNLYVHFLGYALGFIVTYVTTEISVRSTPGISRSETGYL